VQQVPQEEQQTDPASLAAPVARGLRGTLEQALVLVKRLSRLNGRLGGRAEDRREDGRSGLFAGQWACAGSVAMIGATMPSLRWADVRLMPVRVGLCGVGAGAAPSWLVTASGHRLSSPSAFPNLSPAIVSQGRCTRGRGSRAASRPQPYEGSHIAAHSQPRPAPRTRAPRPAASARTRPASATSSATPWKTAPTPCKMPATRCVAAPKEPSTTSIRPAPRRSGCIRSWTAASCPLRPLLCSQVLSSLHTGSERSITTTHHK
jgi:hypothetical protein